MIGPAGQHEHAFGWSEAKALATGDGMERFVHMHERADEPHEHVLRDGGTEVKSTTWSP